MSTSGKTLSSCALRSDQWDLIVLALERIRGMATGDTQYSVDKLARLFLCRRCKEIVAEIQDTVPEAGKK